MSADDKNHDQGVISNEVIGSANLTGEIEMNSPEKQTNVSFKKVNGFWVGSIEGCSVTITKKTEAACRKWTAHYINNHLPRQIINA